MMDQLKHVSRKSWKELVPTAPQEVHDLLS